MAKPVLVTSAAGGTQGRTGRHVAEMLLARGVPVRAFVHRIDERSDQLKSLGAEIFVGDFLDVRSVIKAVKDVSSIYYAYPVQDGLGDATAAMAFAAHEEGISRLVNLVMFQSSTEAPTPRMRQNFLAEQVFGSARIGAVSIRATILREYRPPGSFKPADRRGDTTAVGQGHHHPSPCCRRGRGADCHRFVDRRIVDGGHRIPGGRDRNFPEGHPRELCARSQRERPL